MATRSLIEPSSDAPPAAERKAARKQSLPARASYIAQRRERALARDARRFELARELSAGAQVEVPAEKGFVVVPPGGMAGADAVIRTANELINSMGHEQLAEIAQRDSAKSYLANHFLDAEQLDSDSPYLQFALSDEVLATVSAYLGLVPV